MRAFFNKRDPLRAADAKLALDPFDAFDPPAELIDASMLMRVDVLRLIVKQMQVLYDTSRRDEVLSSWVLESVNRHEELFCDLDLSPDFCIEGLMAL